MIKDTAGFSMSKSDVEELIEILHKNYDGYLFSEWVVVFVADKCVC
ncbi:MAG: hypothetical protein HPY74_10965 [Firmicutes bacterium]|nr:hypothetical protein [Bacillota bacterium]